MYKAHIEIRVRYVETDRMGLFHHAHYFSWMEAARTELLRKNGISYRELEDRGFLLPVREAYCRYRKGLKYDDVATVESELLKLEGASLKIGYKIYLQNENIIAAEGYTVHPFTDKTGKIVRTPEFFKKMFS